MLRINGKEFELLKPSADQLEDGEEVEKSFLYSGGAILCRCQNDDSIHFVMRWIDAIQTYAENGFILDEEFKSEKYNTVFGVLITTRGKLDMPNSRFEGNFYDIYPVRQFGDKVIFVSRMWIAPLRLR